MLFRDARLKIKRANEHIANAKRRIGAVTNPNSQTIWTEFNTEHQCQVIHYRLDKFTDLPDIALVIGDAIHNLNTALDYAWLGTISVVAPILVSNYAKFPVHPSAKQLKSVLQGKQLHTISPELFKMVVQKIQPYDGGDFSIWCVHEMDIMDKHRIVIPTAGHGSPIGLKLKDERGGVHETTFWAGEILPEFTVAIAPSATIEENGHISFEIIFKDCPPENLEVTEMLDVFSNATLGVLKLLEALV